jgi:hypothetical protein
MAVSIVSEEQGFNALTKAYKSNPTIENYVRMRRESPDVEIEVSVTGGLDWLFANEQLLRDIGAEPQWFASALDANPEAISKLSLHLLERIVERKLAEGAGQTHVVSLGKGISDSLVNYFVAVMLDALSWNDELEIPRDLIVLVRHQLIGDGETAQSKQLQVHRLEQNIRFIGAQLLEQGKQPTARKIAKILGVNASTVSRVYPGEKLLEEARRWLEFSQWFHKSETPFADLRAKHNK